MEPSAITLDVFAEGRPDVLDIIIDKSNLLSALALASSEPPAVNLGKGLNFNYEAAVFGLLDRRLITGIEKLAGRIEETRADKFAVYADILKMLRNAQVRADSDNSALRRKDPIAGILHLAFQEQPQFSNDDAAAVSFEWLTMCILTQNPEIRLLVPRAKWQQEMDDIEQFFINLGADPEQAYEWAEFYGPVHAEAFTDYIYARGSSGPEKGNKPVDPANG